MRSAGATPVFLRPPTGFATRSLRLLSALLLVLSVAGAGHAHDPTTESDFVPLELPEPPLRFVPEDAPPPDGEEVQRALGTGLAALSDAARELVSLDAELSERLEPELEEQLLEPLAASAPGGAEASRARGLAERLDRLRTGIGAARDGIDAALREIMPLAERQALRGSIMARLLAELGADLTLTEGNRNPRSRVEAAHRAAGSLADALRRGATDPGTLDEALLRRHFSVLRSNLDDLAEAIYPQPKNGHWGQFLRPELVPDLFGTLTCGGEWVTIIGTPGDDRFGITGFIPVTDGADVIKGLEGNDEIWGERKGSNNQTGGDDIICGGPGEDEIEGWVGRDYLYGGSGDDIVVGGWGDDFVYGGSGDDFVYGLGDRDVLHGGPGHDQLFGDGEGDYKDWVYGDDGDDIAHGGGGDDQVIGGSGSDYLYGDDGDDWVLGGPSDGDLWANVGSTPVTEVNGGPAAWYYKCGGPDWDYLWGGDGNDKLYGEAGKDWLDGGEGDDELHGDYVASGGSGDCLWGDEGEDVLYGENGEDVLLGRDDDDTLYGGDGADKLFGQGGNDELYGNLGNDVLVGDYCFIGPNTNPGDDTLFGGAHNDLLWGQEGNDALNGQAGDDACDGGPGTNTLSSCEGVIPP